MKNRPLQFIWYNFILTMIFLIILFSMQDLYGMTFINNGLAVLYSFTILCLFLSEWNKYFYLLFLFLWFHPAIRWRFFEALKDFVPLVISMVINQGLIEEYNKAFLNIVFILFVPTYLIFYYNIKVKKRTVFLFIIGFILFYTQYYFGSLRINRAILYFTFTLILYGYNNFTKNVEKANISSNLQKGYLIRWITLITIFVMGTNLFIKLLPFKNEPLIKGGENLSNYFNFKPKSFSLSMTGYQRDGSRLGGPIKDDYSIAMIVTTNEDLGEIHLRGSIKTVYNGSKWVKLDNLKEYKITSEVNDISGLNRAKKLNIKLRNISYEIKPQKINTETLFSPLYLDYIKIASNKEIFMDEDGEIYSSENLNTNDVYYVQSLYYDYNNLEEYIKKASKNTSQMNKEKYLQIPPNVPERVLNFSKDLTKPYQDRTNLVKAAVIERYLKSSFPYSKDVSTLPKDREFVDYFLFEEKKGYCSYFATAMVILCRASNIPARYVEGYAKNIYKGVNKIINKDAHAWVEVYTDELGWVTFDPTPGHISISDYLPNYLFSIEEKDKENEEKKEETKTEKDNIEKRPTQRPTDIKEEEKRVIVPKYVYLAFIILFIYLLCYGVFVVKADKVARIMNKIIYYGKINRVTYDRNMTIREYLEKLEGVLSVDLNKVKDILDSILYGNKRISNYELNILNRKLKLIKQKTKEKAKIKYYFKNIPYIALEPFYYLFEYLIKNVI